MVVRMGLSPFGRAGVGGGAVQVQMVVRMALSPFCGNVLPVRTAHMASSVRRCVRNVKIYADRCANPMPTSNDPVGYSPRKTRRPLVVVGE